MCDVWDQNNQALQFLASCVNENAPSLFMTSNKAGTQSGLICSWMQEAMETAACLACVWVTELVRDGGWESTSGPQLVCHSLNLLPAAITSGRLSQDQGLNSLSLSEVGELDCTHERILWHVSDFASIWTKHVRLLMCFFHVHWFAY